VQKSTKDEATAEGAITNLKKINLETRKGSGQNETTKVKDDHDNGKPNVAKEETKKSSARLSACPDYYDPADLDMTPGFKPKLYCQRQLPWFLGGGPFY
jgi:hypothetical protein